MMEERGTRVEVVRRVSGAPLDVPAWTLVDVVQRAARDHPDRPAFLDENGDTHQTWAQLDARIRRVAHGLVALGVHPGDRVGILSETRAEWIVADIAVMMIGGVSVSAFPTLTPAAIGEAFERSDVRTVFVENQTLLEKAASVPTLAVERWITFEPSAPSSGEWAKRVLSFEALEKQGEAAADAEPDALRARAARVTADDVASIVYTSGTTGKPKGVALAHRNLVANSLGAIEHLRLQPHPVGLAFLPLAHSYQRQSGVVLALLAGAVAFSAPARLPEALPRIRPTLLPSVPRLYERMYARIQAMVKQQPRRRQRIFAWAEATARAHGRFTLAKKPVPWGLRLRHALFERLVYRRIRRMAGLDRLHLAITGAAAMREDLLCFFRGIGVPIVEGYGLTETAAPATVNPPGAERVGTVGTPLPGVEVALADDGEVLLHGPNVFVGYDRLPDDTREAFVEHDGKAWLRTGDLGTLDEWGYLRIVDRKKELEILDTGKDVAPLPIEEALKASPLVAEAVIVAHARKYVACLVQPDFEALLEWADQAGIAYDKAQTQEGRGPTGEVETVRVDPALVRHPEVVARYGEEVARVNEALAKHEHVRTLRLLDHALSAELGEVTPTLKKRRRTILETRREDVAALFAGP